ncbi:MAG: hypothetical protein Q9170_007388 [Blastenia crenularia]
MLLSFLALLPVFQLVQYTTALPAGPVGENGDGTLLIPSGDSTNLSAIFSPIVLPPNADTATGQAVDAKRPGNNHIWPEVPAAKYYIKFNNYGKDLVDKEGKALLYKAQIEIEGWIKSAKKGAYTPVDSEHQYVTPDPPLPLSCPESKPLSESTHLPHSWSEGRSFLTIKPEHDGYLLGDLEKYITQITAFHARYGGYWAWEAQLLRKGFMGILIATGRARLQTR